MNEHRAYYNEIDPYCAQWLRNLIDAGHIAAGDVDERSIEDVRPVDLRGYTQLHFFAGIGLWSHALRLAGWQDDRPVTTCSCPCQPFSAAGEGVGFADERHLWPAFFHLMRGARELGIEAADVVFGEQVERAIAYGWLDLVQTDLEGEGNAFATATLNSASVGAPNQRHRIYWVAHADGGRQRNVAAHANEGWPRARSGDVGQLSRGPEGSGSRNVRGALADSMRWRPQEGNHESPEGRQRASAVGIADCGDPGRVASTDSNGLSAAPEPELHDAAHHVESRGELGHTIGDGLEGRTAPDVRREGGHDEGRAAGCASGTSGFWADADWIYCRDGKYRPVEPGTFPLAHGSPARVGRLRAYGNAINPEVAAEFIRAYLDVRGA